MTELDHCTTTNAPEKECENMTKETLIEAYNLLVENFGTMKKEEFYLNSNEVEYLFKICEEGRKGCFWGVPVYIDECLPDNIMRIISGDEVSYIRIRGKPDEGICPFVLEDWSAKKL